MGKYFEYFFDAVAELIYFLMCPLGGVVYFQALRTIRDQNSIGEEVLQGVGLALTAIILITFGLTIMSSWSLMTRKLHLFRKS